MLHKAGKVRGYHMHAVDGMIGHVDEFLFDDAFTIRYLVVDTSNWLGGKWVLISTLKIAAIDSPEKQIYVDLTRDQIKQSPSIATAQIEPAENLPSFIII